MLIYFTVLSAQPARKLSFAMALLKFHAGLLICFTALFALLLGFYGYFIFAAVLALGIYLMIGGYREGKNLMKLKDSNKLKGT